MNIERRLSRLERWVAAERPCKACQGVDYGVTFENPPPQDHDFKGRKPPAAVCASCGRVMPKQYGFHDVATWEAL